MNADNFSVRWTGTVAAPATGTYRFQTVSDDGVRVWVNGVQVINNWTDHSSTTNTSGTINLIAGTRYSITIEYYENGGQAVARLRWLHAGQQQLRRRSEQPAVRRRRDSPPASPGAGLKARYFNNTA